MDFGDNTLLNRRYKAACASLGLEPIRRGMRDINGGRVVAPGDLDDTYTLAYSTGRGMGISRRALLLGFDDPGTIGCVLDVLRKAVTNGSALWGGWVEIHRDHLNLFHAELASHDEDGALVWIPLGNGGTCEAEAIVVALEYLAAGRAPPEGDV